MTRLLLYSPQIPDNTGNIVRTCACTGADLVLVEPIGFHTSDRALKRAGLDYWLGVNVQIIDDLEEYLAKSKSPFTFFSSQAKTPYTEIPYSKDHLLIFGSETAGLPSIFWERWPERFAKIPMVPGSRCLNLANAAAVALYEVIRQQGLS